jgi:hypothetical protein
VSTIALHPTDPDWPAVGIELGGVMRSPDAGATWQDHNPQAYSDAHRLLTHPLAPTRLYEAAGQGIARSEDLGENWVRLDGGRHDSPMSLAKLSGPIAEPWVSAGGSRRGV